MSFLDASAFLYLGCGNTDEDKCALYEAGRDDTDERGDGSTTSTITVTATPAADCAFWDEGFGWQFEIYNIVGWADRRRRRRACTTRRMAAAR